MSRRAERIAGLPESFQPDGWGAAREVDGFELLERLHSGQPLTLAEYVRAEEVLEKLHPWSGEAVL